MEIIPRNYFIKFTDEEKTAIKLVAKIIDDIYWESGKDIMFVNETADSSVEFRVEALDVTSSVLDDLLNIAGEP